MTVPCSSHHLCHAHGQCGCLAAGAAASLTHSSWDSSVPRPLIRELFLALVAAAAEEPLFRRQPGFGRRRLQHLDFICGHLESMKDAGLLIPF